MRSQKILPSQMSDDALLDLVAFAKRLDQPDSCRPLGALTERRNKPRPPETLHIAWYGAHIQ